MPLPWTDKTFNLNLLYCKAVVFRNVRVLMSDTSQRSASRASSLCVFIKAFSQPPERCEERFLFAPGGKRQEES